MNYEKYYRLTSPANRAELNEFNKFIPLVFNIQKDSAKGQRTFKLRNRNGKELNLRWCWRWKIIYNKFSNKESEFSKPVKTNLFIDPHYK